MLHPSFSKRRVGTLPFPRHSNITTLDFVHKRSLFQAERSKRAAIPFTRQAAVYGRARQHGGQNKETQQQVHMSASQNTDYGQMY